MTDRVLSTARCRPTRLLSDERGVILIQLALALVVLLGFSALVIDYGVMLVARAQAQNAADAGALAAATSLAFDTMIFPDVGSTTAEESARAVASLVPVWGEAAGVDTSICLGVSFDGNPSGTDCPEIKTTEGLQGFPPLLTPGRTYFGATVKVYRNGENDSNSLTTYFARLFGMPEQGVRAQATALMVPANTSTCVWPLAIPDFWVDGAVEPGNPEYVYVSPADIYAAPPSYVDGLLSGSETPSGIQVTTFDSPSDSLPYGPLRLVGLLGQGLEPPTLADPWPAAEDPRNAVGGRPVAVSIPRNDGGGFSDNLRSCNNVAIHIGESLAVDTTATFDEAISGALERNSADPAATFDGPPDVLFDGTLRIRGSCAADVPSCAAISPRLVLLPVFHPGVYETTSSVPEPGHLTPTITIVNFVGFFINAVDDVGDVIMGNLTTYPGAAEFGPAENRHPFVLLDNSPLRTVVLTR